MKLCPHCKATYSDDANFCPQEGCATPTGPQRLQPVQAVEAPRATAPGRFQLGPRLGGGSTGEVYRATDTQTGAQVAYKIVNFEVLPNPAALARAERELKQLMRVHSPRIAAVVDCGRTPDERLYVALELVEGEPLDRLLKGGALPLDRAKAIVAQIGQALLEAQKAGIVHRDVAPKNVIVDMSGDVKVINFPIAKPINDKASGVAAYLSPEQVQGKPVDQRSNTYSLAALFYHLITGEPPFQGTPETVLELHLSSPPLAPTQRRPQAGLTPDADRVILKALDKSSSRRHLTLRLFLSEVDALTVPASAPAAPAPGTSAGQGKEGAGAGFARTMLFAGGQAEVANLVARAIASRTGSPAGGVPVSGAIAGGPDQAATPVVQPVLTPSARRPGAPAPSGLAAAPAPSAPAAAKPPSGPEQAPTTVPLPILNVSPGSNGSAALHETADRGARLTPPPVTPYPPGGAAPPGQRGAEAASRPAPAASPSPAPSAPRAPAPEMAQAGAAGGAGAGGAGASGGPGGGKGAAFRETLWFKKGDVEHMIAEARAKMSSQGARHGEAEVAPPGEDIKPIEDRYVDDGSLTPDDRKKFSLRTGGTATSMPTVKPGKVPGETMSEQDVIREVSGSRRAVVIAVAAIVVVAVVAAVMMMMVKGRPSSSPPAKPPAAAAVPAPPPSRATTGAAATAPTAPPKTSKRETKMVAAPPSKRSDSDKRASRRKTKSPDRHKRR